jgi:hypothetical protein
LALTHPKNPEELASTLVHEFQHSKLSALLDVANLFDTTSHPQYYAPWRSDPRPIGGLMQGVYAFLGVADTWHRLAAHPKLKGTAERAFADVRVKVDVALAALEMSSELTLQGKAFAVGMRASTDALLAQPLHQHVVDEANRSLRRTTILWRLRHQQPDPERVTRFTRAFLATAALSAETNAPADDNLEEWADVFLALGDQEPARSIPEPELFRLVCLEARRLHGEDIDIQTVASWLAVATS